MCHKVGNGAGTVGGTVIPRVEHAQESPLCPAVEIGIACAYLTLPVETEADFVELVAVACDVLRRSHLGVLSGLDGILLGGQAESVVAHGMEYVEAVEALVAGEYVGGDVAQRVSDMQTGSRGIREHVENIIFGFVAALGRGIDTAFFPLLLPAAFDFLMLVFHCLVAV